ncbi:MAG TPA: Ku protein [Gemmatimonadales bacterium]|jgi:DNA end-binding protein Ku
MSARPIGSATLSFGLVSVPIQLYSSSESRATISFNWLHKECGSRLKQQYVCKQDNKVVENDDRVKGYEFGKNQYVTFTAEEIKALEEQKKESIDITEFVPADQVGRNLVSKVYYLGPDKGGARAYRLLSAALRETGLSAIARHAARGKQYLVLIRPEGDGLVLEQLYYADEVRPFSEVPLGEAELKPDELKLAVQFIQQAARDAFDPTKYEDDVRKRMLEQIERKIAGKEITAAPEEEPQTQIIDLMEALKQSLARGDARKEAAKAGEASRKPRRKAAGGDA